MSSRNRMLTLRAKRKLNGLKEIRFWVRGEDLEKAKNVASVFQKLALQGEVAESIRELEEELKERLKEFGVWESYLGERYDFTLAPSTERQRKFALRVAASAREEIPEAILKHKGLLSGWIKEILKK